MVDVTKRAKGPAGPLALIGSALAIPAGLLPAYGMTSIIPPLDFARVCRNRCWPHCNRLYRLYGLFVDEERINQICR